MAVLLASKMPVFVVVVAVLLEHELAGKVIVRTIRSRLFKSRGSSSNRFLYRFVSSSNTIVIIVYYWLVVVWSGSWIRFVVAELRLPVSLWCFFVFFLQTSQRLS